MRKKIKFLSLIIIIISLSCLSVKEEIKSDDKTPVKEPAKQIGPEIKPENISVFNDVIGQYAYYLDSRKTNDPKFIGLLFNGDNRFFIRTYELYTKKESKTFFRIKKNNDKINLSLIQSDLSNDSQELASLKNDILFLLNNYTLIDKNFLKEKKEISNITINDEKEIECIYKFWVPFFSLYSIKIKNDKRPFLELIKTGMIEKKDDEHFFKYNEIQVANDGFDYRLQIKKKVDFILNGVNLNLDQNWNLLEKNNNQQTNNEIIGITKSMIIYSQIEVEQFDLAGKDTDNIYDFIKLRLTTDKSNIILPDTVKITSHNDKILVSYEIINPLFNVKHIINSIFIVKNEKDIKIVNFTTFKKAYRSNKDYFDKLVTDILKRPYIL